MSSRKIALTAYAAFESGHLEPLLEQVSDDIELGPIVGSVTGEPYHGREALVTSRWRCGRWGTACSFDRASARAGLARGVNFTREGPLCRYAARRTLAWT